MNALIIDAVRTPIGRFRGALATMRADDLAATAIAALVARTKLAVEECDDVIFGCANQAGEDNRNVARMALLLAGLPESVPGVTVNRLCGSGLEAVLAAARAISAGEGDMFIAGGVESMTRAPWVVPKAEGAFPNGNVTMFDTSLGWRFPNERLRKLFPLEAMGETAENLATRFVVSRSAQDEYALRSHQKAVAAETAGRFADERTVVTLANGEVFAKDEGPRADTTLEKLAKLKPVFRPKEPGASVTAGNSAGLNDGAAAVLICSEAYAKRHGYTPMCRLVAGAAAGVDPRYMGIGPVPATRRVLARAGWQLGELDLIEMNEAFAVQVLSVCKELGLDANDPRINPSGGSIALGHPLGCSGARIVTTLAHEMRRGGAKRALATMCVGVGQGISALFAGVV